MTQNVQLPARFANRQQKRSIVQAVTAGLGSASPPYVSIEGNVFTLVDANGEKEPVETKHLDCVLFDVNLDVPIQRVYWGKSAVYKPGSDSYNAPVCFSDNGIGASINATEPQSASCQTCEQNVWGSEVSKLTGKGVKACKAFKKVAVLPVEGKVGADGSYVPEYSQDFPFLLRVPVMSHENLRAYSAKFSGQDFDVSDVVTRITFVHGQNGVLDFAAAGFTDQATEDLIQKFLAAKLTDGLIGRGDVPWKGEVRQIAQAAPVQALPQAQPTPAPAAPTPFAPQEPVGQSEPAKRTRRTKAEMEAARAGQQGAAVPFPPQGQAEQAGIPPFLQRPQAVPNGPLPAHGIQANAPAPNAELESALANVFGLKT